MKRNKEENTYLSERGRVSKEMKLFIEWKDLRGSRRHLKSRSYYQGKGGKYSVGMILFF